MRLLDASRFTSTLGNTRLIIKIYHDDVRVRRGIRLARPPAHVIPTRPAIVTMRFLP